MNIILHSYMRLYIFVTHDFSLTLYRLNHDSCFFFSYINNERNRTYGISVFYGLSNALLLLLPQKLGATVKTDFRFGISSINTLINILKKCF